jgi:transposase-like protein
MKITRQGRVYTQAEKTLILQKLSQWQGSESAFCREIGFSLTTLQRWRHAAEQSNSSKSRNTNKIDQIEFIEYGRASNTDNTLTVLTPKGLQLTLPHNMPVVRLVEILRQLSEV